MTIQIRSVFLPRLLSRLQDLRAVLSADELERAARFHFERDRERFILARGMLRQLLSPYLGCEPTHIVFRYGPSGKPALDTAGGTVGIVQFNLSHTGDYCIYAMTHGGEIGVDAEVIRADIECLALAERYFSKQEYESLRLLSETDRPARFFQYWTCKEAYLKARGLGLSHGLTGLAYSCGADGSVTYEADGTDPWLVRPIHLPGPLAAAVAARGDCWDVVLVDDGKGGELLW